MLCLSVWLGEVQSFLPSFYSFPFPLFPPPTTLHQWKQGQWFIFPLFPPISVYLMYHKVAKQPFLALPAMGEFLLMRNTWPWTFSPTPLSHYLSWLCFSSSLCLSWHSDCKAHFSHTMQLWIIIIIKNANKQLPQNAIEQCQTRDMWTYGVHHQNEKRHSTE